MPFAMLALTIVTGGDLIHVIIGIIAGHIYFFLKDIAPLENKLDILRTPKFVVDLTEKYIYPNINIEEERHAFTVINNPNDRSNNNNNNNNNEQRRNNFSNERRGYVPFSGSGHRLD